ncbi:MAG: glycosyltransferase, partial [Acidimicrobiales bacterium]
MSEPGLELSIVVPAHNESSRLAAGYARLAPTLERLGPERVEVVVVDDGSTDATGEAAARVYGSLPHLRVIALPENRGKGAALRLGLRVARGPLVVTADADMAIDPRHIPEVMTALERADLAPGSRTGDGRITYDAPWRTLAGAAFSRLVHHYVRTPLRDTQCGFKGYRLGAGRLLALLAHVQGFAIDVELFHLAGVLGLSVEPVPVTWSDVPGSSVHPGRVALDVLRDVRGLAATRYVNPAV